MEQGIRTATLAKQIDGKAASIRTAVWRNGHFYGIVPVKMSPGKSGRLLWPADSVARIIAAAGGTKLWPADAADRLIAGEVAQP